MRNSLKVVDDESGWVPRSLPGGKYCSPRCGGPKGFCTRAAFDRATKDSAAVAARLGEGWTPRVWENLGWHWEVARGDGECMTVRENDGHYSAEFKSVPIMHGKHYSTATQFFADADTPEEAIGLVRQDVRTFIARLQDDLADTI